MKPNLTPGKALAADFGTRRFLPYAGGILAIAMVAGIIAFPAHGARLRDESGAASSKKPVSVDSQKPKGRSRPLAQWEKITMNFDNAELRTVIKFISELTGRNFLVDDRVKGTVTIISPTEITVGEAYQVFLSVLEMKGYTVVEAGKITKIIPSREARHRDVLTVRGEEPLGVRREDRIITQIVPLSFANASDLRGMLQPLVSKDSHLAAYAPTNTLFITDYASNIKRLLSIIKDMDVEGSDEKITVVPLKYASAQTLSNELLSIVETRGTGPVRRSVRRPSAARASAISVSKLISDQRTNSLIIVANQQETQKLLNLIQKLDQPLPPGRARIHVHYLENAKAEDLVQVLTQLPAKAAAAAPAGGKAPAAAMAPILGRDVQILADKPTNSLIILASPHDYETLRGVIEKLDIMRPQVLVEGLIAEVSLDKFKELGVDWQAVDQPWSDTTYFGSSRSRSGVLQNTPEGQLNSLALFGGLAMGVFKGPITIAGQQFFNISALIRAFQNTSDVDILSTPHILTLDNEEAEIVVAENRPFLKSQTGTAESTSTTEGGVTTGVIQTFEFKDVGITLRITPQISLGKFVRLNIYQEVSDVISEQEVGVFTSAKRQARTTVVVEDGQTVVIGGLIQDRRAGSESGVPCLASIPGLGAIFRTRQKTGTKRNLLIFITPHILNTPESLAAITEKKRRESEESKKEDRKGVREEMKETFDMIVK